VTSATENPTQSENIFKKSEL